MSKIIIYKLLLFLVSTNILAQSELPEKDWIAILSGEVESYNNYNIKSVSLLSDNNFVIKSILHNPDEGSLIVKRGDFEYQYEYDRYNRITAIHFKYQSHLLSYFDTINKISSYQLKLDNDSSFIYQTVSFPYKEHPKTEWFVLEEKSKIDDKIIYIRSTKNVLDARDSLNGYYEWVLNKSYKRFYLSGITESFDEKSNEYRRDSLVTNPNGRVTGTELKIKGDSIWERIIKMDSIFEYSSINKKLYNLKIRYGENLQIQREQEFDPETQALLTTKEFTYFPFKNSMNLVLWEIKTFNNLSKKISVEFPNKKKYRLKRNQLFEKRKVLKKNDDELKSYYISKHFTRPNSNFNVGSTSIFGDSESIEDAIYDNEELTDYLGYLYIKQGYIHSQFLNSDSTTNFVNIFPYDYNKQTLEKLRPFLIDEYLSINKKARILSGMRKVEVKTHDGNVWVCDASEYYNKIKLNMDLFMFEEVEKYEN